MKLRKKKDQRGRVGRTCLEIDPEGGRFLLLVVRERKKNGSSRAEDPNIYPNISPRLSSPRLWCRCSKRPAARLDSRVGARRSKSGQQRVSILTKGPVVEFSIATESGRGRRRDAGSQGKSWEARHAGITSRLAGDDDITTEL